MSEVDWSKAPEGFNYAMTPGIRWDGDAKYIGIVDFARREGNDLFDQHGRRFSVDQTCWVILAERPLPWSGEGLPPAGTVCEFLDRNTNRWLPVEIVFLSSWVVVVRDTNAHPDGAVDLAFDLTDVHPQFRPARTAKQIAAEEREKAIDVMAEDLRKAFANPRIAARTLYDAGYRKVEGGAA